ncbi:MAG: two-component system response regulator [Oleiphilus sp.]|nr:MAG: two-component system response regulator [Oleiphilus sp.]
MNDCFRIFLAEDDPDDQYLLKLAFEETAVTSQIDCFENGKLLYEALRELGPVDARPHLILLDLNLPVWDGKRTLGLIKKNPSMNSIPVVVYTTSRSQTDVDEVYSLGANSYIVKPAKYQTLLENVDVLTRYWFRLVRFSKNQKLY